MSPRPSSAYPDSIHRLSRPSQYKTPLLQHFSISQSRISGFLYPDILPLSEYLLVRVYPPDVHIENTALPIFCISLFALFPSSREEQQKYLQRQPHRLPLVGNFEKLVYFLFSLEYCNPGRQDRLVPPQ